MEKTDAFVVKIDLDSSVIIGTRLCLDGILAALIFERTRSEESAHNEIPLSRSLGVWSGSSALIESPAPVRQVSVIQSLRADLDISPETIAPGKRGYPRVETARGSYRNKMTPYLAYDADAVWFSGSGNVDAVKSLLDGAVSIGTKRNIGYGKISKVTIEKVRSPNAGISYSDGTPARPIPESLWKDDSRIHYDTASETFAPPYWKGDRVLCVLPKHQIVLRKEAKALIYDSSL